MDKWIPIKASYSENFKRVYENLPEDSQMILFTTEYISWSGHLHREVLSGRYDKYKHTEMNDYPWCYMTAWMPIPDPYEEEREDV